MLCVQIQQNLKWSKNTEYIGKRASNKLWVKTRLKKLGLETEFLVDIYTKEIRSILEYAVPVWQSGITIEQSKDIEYIQRLAVSIILNDWTLPYFVKCTLLNLEPLFLRRPALALTFAKRTAKSANHDDFFTKNCDKKYNTRSDSNMFKEHKCNQKRFYDSPLPYMTRALNKNMKKKNQQ